MAGEAGEAPPDASVADKPAEEAPAESAEPVSEELSEEEIAKRKAERKAKREAERAAKKAAEAGGEAPAKEELTDEERERRKAERKAAREAERAAKKAAEGEAPAKEELTDEEREKRRAERKAAREAAKADGGEEKPKREKKERPPKDDAGKKKEKKSAIVLPERKFILSSSPHIHDKESVRKIMWTVTATLIPATIGATWVFGFRALILVVLGMIAAMLTEWGLQKVFKMKSTVADGSALLTGLLVSFNLPPGVPWWIPVIGSFFAIAVAKMPFGGLGWNPMNPALVGRAFLLASWPLHMTKDWLPAFWWKNMTGYNFWSWNVNPAAMKIDGVSYATPLGVRKSAIDTINNPEGLPNDIITRAMETIHSTGDMIVDLITGVTGGCIGETSAILLLLGAAYLLYKGIIDWRTPFAFIATVGIGGWLFGGADGFFSGDMLFHVFAGGLILGAFYMATDMVTTPITKKGRLYFGLGAGLLTLMIRLIGGYPEGVSYAILLMNLTTPLIDRYTKPRRFGHVKTADTAAAGG